MRSTSYHVHSFWKVSTTRLWLQERGGPSRDVEVAAVAAAVARFESLTGRRPRILIAKMGQVLPGGGRRGRGGC
jgi:hypothetical protein